MDLYMPNETKGPFPVVLAIHGGAFLFGDKGDGQQNAALNLVKHGYAVAAINYRLADEAQFPAGIHDVKAAIRFVKANAEKYNLDPNKIILWGDSAGAYLAVIAGVTGGSADLDDLSLGNGNQNSKVQVVIDWFGPVEFNSMDDDFRASGKGKPDHSDKNSPESKFLGVAVSAADASILNKANPLHYIANGPADIQLPAFYIQHGDVDNTVPTEQSLKLFKALKKYYPSLPVELSVLNGAGHGDPLFESDENINKIIVFLNNHLP
jgi:acetyl esterase/lipase